MQFQLANAPCSWGVIEQVENNSVTYQTVLDEISGAGFTGTEMGQYGFMPTDPDALRDALETRGLSMVGCWVTVSPELPTTTNEQLAIAVKTATLMQRAAGDSPIVVLGPWRPTQRAAVAGRVIADEAPRLSDAEWDTYASGLIRIASAVRNEAGLRCVFHPHGGSWVETEEETHRLMNNTDPNLIGLCVDTGHVQFGGGDAAKLLETYTDRVWLVHLKDLDFTTLQKSIQEKWNYETSIINGIFTELGSGAVDFKSVFNSLKATEYNGWLVVEQDIGIGLGNPKESANRNFQYLQSMLTDNTFLKT